MCAAELCDDDDAVDKDDDDDDVADCGGGTMTAAAAAAVDTVKLMADDWVDTCMIPSYSQLPKGLNQQTRPS